MTGSDILLKSKDIITGERQDQYGNPERNFDKIAQFFTVYLADQLRKPITGEQVGVMMALMKIARITTGVQKDDSYIDACGYLALSGEMAAERR